MDVANQIIFFAGALLLVSIIAGLLSSRIGAPLLLVFIGLGMLIGEDGPGGVAFNDYGGVFFVASLGLAIILFDGGLRTPLSAVRLVWAPALSLATLGVLITAGITGLVAMLTLDLGVVESLLIGAIVASTDAAAVFLLLHQRGMDLKKRVGATLEVESGANDPMAVFLTVTLAELLMAGGGDASWSVLTSFFLQMGMGAAIGIGGGYALAWAINRMELASGLYPVLAIAGALFIFGGSHFVGGSGFLAVYLAGIVAGNQRLRANQLIHRFHDGLSWVSQIVMFFLLGLLVTPSSLLTDLIPAGLIALALIFVARPLAVLLCLLPFRFPREERLFIAWVGLRGAVPLYLAIIPILAGVTGSLTYFNVAFVVVLASVVLQGWTVPWVGRRLDVQLPPVPETAGRLDLDLTPGMDRDLYGWRVEEGSPAAARPFAQLHMPRRTRVLAILRDGALIPRETLDRLMPDDQVLALCPPEQSIKLDRLFGKPTRRRERTPTTLGDFAFPASTTLGALADTYDLPVAKHMREQTVGAYLDEHLPGSITIGDHLRMGEVDLIVREMKGDGIQVVGLRLAGSDERRGLRDQVRDSLVTLKVRLRIVPAKPKAAAAAAPADENVVPLHKVQGE